ncbi:YeaC family protein [Aurantivibrio infirmus]
MNFSQLIDSINPEVYENLKTAIELGKWPDGRRLSKDQQALCLEAIISYESKHFPPEQRTGYITPKKHQACDSADTSADAQNPDQEQAIKWQDS